MFDTYKAMNALMKAGFDNDQAVALVSTIGDALTGDLATKADIAEVKMEIAEVRGEVAEVRVEIAEVKGQVAEVKVEIAEVRGQATGLKAQMAADKAELKAQMAADKAEIKEDINGVRLGVLKQMWVLGLSIVTLNVSLTVGITVAAMKLLQ